MTGRETLQARPSAALLGTKTYGTFYDSPELLRISQNPFYLTYLFLTEERKVKQNLQWLCVCCKDDELCDTTV